MLPLTCWRCMLGICRSQSTHLHNGEKKVTQFCHMLSMLVMRCSAILTGHILSNDPCRPGFTFHCSRPRGNCKSPEGVMIHIAPVYSDYGLTLALIIFDLALIPGIDPSAPSSWARVCSLVPRWSHWGVSVTAFTSSMPGTKWIDLTWIHWF